MRSGLELSSSTSSIEQMLALHTKPEVSGATVHITVFCEDY